VNPAARHGGRKYGTSKQTSPIHGFINETAEITQDNI
jgi:hypothetical protein